MDNASQKISHIHELLLEEEEELSIFQENLDKSDQLTQNMVSILSSFENRLKQLEETILPVHTETVNLQKLQQNVESALTAFDDVLKHHDAVKELEQVIKNGPGDELEHYLSQLNQVIEAKKFFEKNNPSSPEMIKAKNLFESGREVLENYFQLQLSSHSHPTAPVKMLQVLDYADDIIDENEAVSLEQLSEKVVKELSDVAVWLEEHGKSTKFKEIYYQTRATVMKKSTEELKDHLAKKSGGSGSDFVKRRIVKLREPLQRKASTILRQGKKGPPKPSFEPGHRKQASLVSESKDDHVDPETDCFLCCATGLLKLIQSEVQVMTSIIPEHYQKDCLTRIVETPMDIVVRLGDNIVQTARRGVHKHDYTAVHGILPVLRYLLSVEKDFDKTLEVTTGGVRGKLPQLISALGNVGAKALDEFFDFVKNDSDKANLPKDGTVHELTSNTIIFLESLNEYVDTVAFMLLQKGEMSYQARQDPNASKKRVATYIGDILGALSLNLLQKAKTYSDQCLGDVFLLNNNHYILKSLQRSGLIRLVQFHNASIEQNYEEIIDEQKKKYKKSWNKVLNHILEGYHPNATRPAIPDPSKMKDKERQVIKEKFKGFNQDFEELFKTQKCYAIADSQLREFIRRDNKDFILPQYTKFWNRYIQTSFTKNVEKYIKYNPQDIENMMDKFFDITA
ncbi:Exocyst complex component 7 [Holothuria leucospilota]|uniref:Exocyst complex component 7 n=1 Tax=Holothuria leucospilota TaxID=206669 RepID=A0A9Q1C2Y9_HOLLE|nr:Exocyst complex component 7 [Holothuria leucospilota]